MSDAGPVLDTIDIMKLMKLLPHRYPFLLVDRIIDIDGDNSAVGIKNVTMNEPHFQGHFPEQPVMPGVLIVEAMAQLSGVLLSQKLEHTGKLAVLLSMDKVKFRRPVRPGDQLVINCKLVKTRGDKLAVAEATCTVGGNVVSSAELMFGVVENGAPSAAS